MIKPLILVSSLTYAIKGKELLIRNGFIADIKRVPKNRKRVGCGYGIYVPNHTDEAEALLKSVPIRVFGRTDLGGIS